MSANNMSRFLSLLLLGFAAMPAQALQMVTEEYPPYNYTEHNQVTGQSTEVVAEMGRRAKTPLSFAIMPWPRAYDQVQTKSNTCIYSIARLENRERVFKWVGLLATNPWGLFARSGFSDPVNTLADVRPYRIGGVTNDAKVVWLRNNAVTNIVTVGEDKLIPPMLTLDRKQLNAVDLWVTSIPAQKGVAAAAGVKDIKLILKINEERLWLACNPGVSDTTVKALADALAGMKKDGAYNKIVQQYEQRLTGK